jgi:transcriptional antiterminator
MNKKLWLLIGGGVVLLAAIIVGAVVALPHVASANSTSGSPTATSTTQNQYCVQFNQDLASRLGVSVSTLEQDRQQAKIDLVNQLEKDGKLTQAQANTLIQRIQSHQACTNVSKQPYWNFVLRQFWSKYRSSIATQVAQGLNISRSQLVSDLKSGESLAQIAKAQHVTSAQLKTIVDNAVNSSLNSAVSAGVLTSAQQSALSTYIQNHPGLVNTLLHQNLKTL